MTPESDDLEQVLRENLKLRRELGAEAARAGAALGAKHGIAYRLGWVLYWIGLATAIGWVPFVLWVASTEGAIKDLQQSPELLVVIALPTVIAYGLGRAFRYLLSGA